MPKLTIGLPVYNSEALVRESIESLLSQTYGDFILHISDNASTDGTPEICQEYVSADDRVIYTRNAENLGMSPNYNLLANRCETPFFKWSTADDLWAPTMVERTMAVIEADPEIALCYPKTTLVNLVTGDEEKYDDNLHLMQDSPAERFLAAIDRLELCNLHLGISRVSALRKTTMLKKYPGADLNFVAELAIYGKFFEFPEYLFFRRFHEDSSSWARGDMEHQKRRFHATKSRDVMMITWHAQFEYFRAALRAPFSPGDRKRVLLYLVQCLNWHRSTMGRELAEKLRSFVPGKAQ